MPTLPGMGRPDRDGGAGAVRPVLTGRALALGALVVLLVVVLASPVQRYLHSRSDNAQAAAQLHADQAEQARLQREQQQWGDPGYIQQQARARLQYAMPGDTVYVVVDPKAQAAKAADQARTSTGRQAWNTRLMDSVQAAAR